MTACDLEKSSSFNKTVDIIQAMCAIRFTCKHITANTCNILRGMGVRKVSNSKTWTAAQSVENSVVWGYFSITKDTSTIRYSAYDFLFSIRSVMEMVRRNFRRLDEEDFLLIYKTYIRNRIRYCVQAWSCTALEERQSAWKRCKGQQQRWYADFVTCLYMSRDYFTWG